MNIFALSVHLVPTATTFATEIIEATPRGNMLRQRRVYPRFELAVDAYAEELASLHELRSMVRELTGRVDA